MEPQGTERKLTSILCADIVGYSRQMEQAEEVTAASLADCHTLIEENASRLGGRIFNRAGDAALAEFPSPVNAVRCGVEIQRDVAALNRQPVQVQPLSLRIGLHLADVIVSGTDLIGDGVNIVARIQETAEPDCVLVSQSLFEQIRRNSPFMFEDLGPRSFKNISEQIRVYKVVGDMPAHRLQSAPSEPRPEVAVTREASIAVLPFAVAGADEEQRYFADGLTDDIIIELARFKQLFVSSRSASFAYAGRAVDPREVGRELGVRFVLEGQVRRIGNDVRISAQLVNAQSGEQLWAERFVRKFDDLFEVLDELIGRIVATIVGRVEAAGIVAARRKRPEDMTAYDCLLRGLEHHRLCGVTVDHIREAVEWFDRAIAADPSYGAAYAWRICAASGLPGFKLEENFHYAQKALEFDENDAEAQRIMGAIKLLYRDFEASEYHHKRALKLNPSDAYIKARSASFYTRNGQPDRALELLENAIELDPFLPVWCIEERGVALYALGRYEEAVEALTALPFQTFRSRLYEAAVRAEMGDLEGARTAIEHALRIRPDLTVSEFLAMETYRSREEATRLRECLASLGLPR